MTSKLPKLLRTLDTSTEAIGFIRFRLAQLRGAMESQRIAVAAPNDTDYEGRSLIPTDFSLWSGPSRRLRVFTKCPRVRRSSFFRVRTPRGATSAGRAANSLRGAISKMRE